MKPGDGIIRKRVEHGAVWITVRVNGHLHDVTASKPGDWGAPIWGGVQHGTARPAVDVKRALDLVTTWALVHAAELDPLFRQASGQTQTGRGRAAAAQS